MVDTPGTRAPTDSGEFQGYASAALMHRYHTEQKVFHSECTKRIQALEFEANYVKERLNNGAATMTRHGDELDAIKLAQQVAQRPKISTVFSVLMALIPSLIMVVWMASRYPDQNRFEELQHQVYDMRERQAVISSQLDRLLQQSLRSNGP